MKKIFLGFVGLLLLGFVVWQMRFFPSDKKQVTRSVVSPTSSLSPSISVSQKRTFLFVPYWTLGNGLTDVSTYTFFIYFGISADTNGIVKDDPGYQGMDTFLKISSSGQKLLAVRMINSDINSKVLDDASLRSKIVADSVEIAKEKGFDGVVLDFEISALAFDAVVKHISDFSSAFARASHGDGLKFYQTVYGDTFYRLRPYDAFSIAKNSDGLLIMAYDFHKAGETRGPNFPLNADDYDLKRMAADFLGKVPASKLTVVFGMFGYDWAVDGKGQSTGTATAVTDLQAKQKFLDGCSLDACQITHDQTSAETEVLYLDGQKRKHEVWFEDQGSVKKKMEFLKSKGINSIGYWAYGYFLRK